MSIYKYWIGCQDYFGKNDVPNKIFNNRIVPYLESCGLKENQIKDIWKLVAELADNAWCNGADDARCSINELI